MKQIFQILRDYINATTDDTDSWRAVSRRTGVHFQTLHRYVNNQRVPPADRLLRSLYTFCETTASSVTVTVTRKGFMVTIIGEGGTSSTTIERDAS